MSVSDRIALMNAGKLEQVGRAGRDLSPSRLALRRRVHGHDQSLQGHGARARRAGLGVAPARGAALRRGGAGRLAAAHGDGRADRDAGAAHPPRCHARQRHADQDGDPRCAASRPGGRRRRVARLRSGAADGAFREALRCPHQQRLPVAIAALGLLFLGVFLLYPLFNVFGASMLDSEGQSFTFANYTKMLGRPFYRAAIVNTLSIGAAATVITTLLAVPLAFALARLPIPGKAAILALAAMPLVLPSFVSAYAIVLLLGNSGIVTQWLQGVGLRLRLDLWRGRHRAGLHADPLSLRAAADRRRLQGGRRVDGGGGARPRLLARPHGAHGDPADRAAGDPGRRAAGLHRDAGEFRRALRAGRGPADLRRRGLQAVHRRDRAQSRLGRRAGDPADPDDGARAAGPAPLPVVAPLRDQYAAGAADPQDRPRSAGSWRRSIAGRSCCWRWCRSSPSSCCRSSNSAAPCCTAISASPTSPPCSTATCARWPTRWSSPRRRRSASP